MKIIYEPTGPAKEYADLALNVYKGCEHRCIYCYAAKMPWTTKEEYYGNANPKEDPISRLVSDAKKLKGNTREILMSFSGDPYQPFEMKAGLTRQAIEVLIKYDQPFTILTKGGTRATRDFDLLEKYEKCRFGTTLVFLNDEDANYWEPNAPSIADRIRAIEIANKKGIRTWVSLEPVIDPSQALAIIKNLHPIVDHWKIGKINHFPKIEKTVDWIKYRTDVTDLLNSLEADYYIKDSLKKL